VLEGMGGEPNSQGRYRVFFVEFPTAMGLRDEE
jgi:hypothetical protein